MCDAAGLNTWSLKLDHGCLYRCQRDANGRTVFSQPPPDGWPDGTPVRVMNEEAGNPTSLVGRATIGAVIEVLVNHGEGVLSYRINGGPVLEALKGFPKGATGQLRPWVQLVHGRVRLNSVLVSCALELYRVVCDSRSRYWTGKRPWRLRAATLDPGVLDGGMTVTPDRS